MICSLKLVLSDLLKVASCSYAPEPGLFHQLFPYHVILDKELLVLQVVEVCLGMEVETSFVRYHPVCLRVMISHIWALLAHTHIWALLAHTQVGSGLLRSTPSLTLGSSIVAHLDILKPYGCTWDFASIARLSSSQGGKTAVSELQNGKGEAKYKFPWNKLSVPLSC